MYELGRLIFRDRRRRYAVNYRNSVRDRDDSSAAFNEVRISSFSTSLGNLPRSISNVVHRYTKNATIVGSRLNSILSRVVRERIERSKQTSKRLT